MNKKIMVVDDTEDNIELMKTILTMHEFEPITFTNPLDGIAYLQGTEQLPDLLILDMRMPEMSGLDFCEQLKKDKKFDKLRVAFFTASSDLDTNLLSKYHALGFIYKPFNINSLIIQINKYLSTPM